VHACERHVALTVVSRRVWFRGLTPYRAAHLSVPQMLIPLMNHIVYPCCRRRGRHLSMLQRIGAGFVLAIVAMGTAALVEYIRLDRVSRGLVLQQKVAGVMVTAADMSVFWQVPQYFLIGCSEVFAATSGQLLCRGFVAGCCACCPAGCVHGIWLTGDAVLMVSGLEFAFSQSPASMRSVVMALYVATNGLGDFLGAVYLLVVDTLTSPSWLPKDLNNGRLDL